MHVRRVKSCVQDRWLSLSFWNGPDRLSCIKDFYKNFVHRKNRAAVSDRHITVRVSSYHVPRGVKSHGSSQNCLVSKFDLFHLDCVTKLTNVKNGLDWLSCIKDFCNCLVYKTYLYCREGKPAKALQTIREREDCKNIPPKHRAPFGRYVCIPHFHYNTISKLIYVKVW